MLTREDLDDSRHFICLGWVPYFDEHEQYDAEGKIVRKVDREWLERLCRTNNEKAGTGDFSAFGPGHTIPNQRVNGVMVPSKEGDQPPHWGYSADWSVKPLPDGTLAAGAVRYVRRQVELPTSNGMHVLEGKRAVSSFPWRSIEYDPAKGDSPYVALLRRPPERNVGAVVSFARGHDTILRGGTSLRCSTGRRARAAVQWGDRLFFSMEMNMADELPDPSKAPDAEALDPAEKDKWMRCARECYPHLEKMHGEAKERYEAAPPVNGAAMASPTNMTMPGAEKKDDDMDLDKFARDLKGIQDANARAVITGLTDRLQRQERKAKFAEAKSWITKLNAQHVDLGNEDDIKDLVERFSRADEAGCQAIYDRELRKNKRIDHAPTDVIDLGEPERIERHSRDGTTPPASPAEWDRVKKIQQFMRQKGYVGEAGWSQAEAEYAKIGK